MYINQLGVCYYSGFAGGSSSACSVCAGGSGAASAACSGGGGAASAACCSVPESSATNTNIGVDISVLLEKVVLMELD